MRAGLIYNVPKIRKNMMKHDKIRFIIDEILRLVIIIMYITHSIVH